jgi:predicted aspartyl protease
MSAITREQADMGRVTTPATIENLRDLWEAESGQRAEADVRRLSVSDALIDTGASTLSLPTSLIRQLGLDKVSSKRVMTAGGPREANRYSAVRLIIQDRDATVDVLEVPDGCPVLVGQIPLEFMDFVVDPSNQRLIGNPAHGGEWTLEMY